jgi:hypothetical protein
MRETVTTMVTACRVLGAGWRVAARRLAGGAWLLLLLTALLTMPASADTALFSSEPVWRSLAAQRTTCMAMGDVDLDGDLDLVCGNYNLGSTLFLNDGGSLRTTPSWTGEERSTRGVVLGDVDGDGDLDLVYANYGQPSALYLNEAGLFASTPAWTGPSGPNQCAALGDIDGDGDLDLICGATAGCALYLNEGGALAGAPVWTGPPGDIRAVALGDVDEDGDLDLVCGTYGQSSTLFLSQGGRFENTPAWASETTNTWSVALGDVNGDGRLDLVCGNSGTATVLYLNEEGRFGAAPAWSSPLANTRGVALGDVDGDGDLDLACGNRNAGNTVFLNEQGTFSVTPGWSGAAQDTWSVALGDLDGDGDLDLLSGNYDQSTTASANLSHPWGNGSVWSWQPGCFSDLALADVDGDGLRDLFFADGLRGLLFRADGKSFGAEPIWLGPGNGIFRLAVGDVDGDGDSDLVCAYNAPPQGPALFLNQEGRIDTTAAWTARTGSVYDIALGDMDGDGRPDLACATSDMCMVYRNRGGSFEEDYMWGSLGPTDFVALGDVDGDGNLDLVAAPRSGGLVWCRNTGGALGEPETFGEPIGIYSMQLEDVDGDGDLDLLCGTDGDGPVLYLNQGERFSEAPVWRGPPATTGPLTLVDVNGDGGLDLLVGSDRELALYTNEGGQLAATPAWSAITGVIGCLALEDVDGDGDLDLPWGMCPWTGLLPGLRNPPYKGDPTAPTRQLPNSDAFLSRVRITPAGANRYSIRLTAIDVESDPVWLVPEYQLRGASAWNAADLAGWAHRAGPLAATPEGTEHELDWDVTSLPINNRPVVLRLRTVSNPRRVGTVQRIPSYLAEAGPLKVLRPVLATSMASLAFTGVTAGDSVERGFVLRNAGTALLEVTGIETPADMVCDLQVPINVPPGDSVAANLTFKPIGAVDRVSLLRIASNDPLRPVAEIEITASARDVTFLTRPAVADAVPPLGEPLLIMVIPDPGVNLSRGAVYYRSAEASAGAPYTRVTMSRFLGTSLLGTIPGDAITEGGVAYYVEVANGSVVHRDPCRNLEICRDSTAAPDTAFVQSVQPPGWVAAAPLAPPGTKHLPGRDLEMELSWPRGTQVRAAVLHYRKGGASAFQMIPFASLGFSYATIPGDSVTARGVEYWAEVRTWGSTLTDPADSPESRPRLLRTTVQDLREEREHPGERYRLLSVPLDFGSDPAGGLQTMLADEAGFGAYDRTRWRAFRYLPDQEGTGTTIEIAAADPLQAIPRPGRGFWLISRDPHQVGTAPLEGLSTPTDEPYAVVLQPGWNQVGNPFPFDVAMADVSLPEDADSLIAFDPSLGESGDYAEDPVRLLRPFEGYFVFNGASAPETLRVAPIEARSDRAPAAGTVPSSPAGSLAVLASPEEWSLRLLARTPRALDGSTMVGVSARAREARDGEDRRKPPPLPGEWVQLAVDNSAWTQQGGRYGRDLRAPGQPGYTWDLELRSARPGDTIFLQASPSEPWPPDIELRLLDLEDQSAIPLCGDDGLRSFLSYGPSRPYRLRLVAGEADFLAAELSRVVRIPGSLELAQNTPNPFRDCTRIRFGLPRPAEVTLELFDVEGARVARLAAGRTYSAGFHTILWDGAAEAGHSAVNGIYFCRLTVGNASLTRRLLRIR